MPSEPPHTPADSRRRTEWRVRTQRPEELAEVMALGDLAFGAEEGIGALVEALQADGSFTGQSYVALAGDRIVGHAMLTRCFLDTEDRVLTIPVLSPLSVHPDVQRQGVGRAVVAYALARAEGDGAMGVVLEGDPAYYSRLGFEPAEPWGLLRPSPRIPRPAFQWVRLPAHEPWMRGRVVYPDVFWRHDAVGLRGLRGPARTLEVTTVTLGARDLPRLVRFYGDLLGREVPEAAELAGEDWVAVRDDDGGITLAVQLEREQERVTWPAGPGEQHLQVHLEIRVDDLERALEHALTCGATLAEHQPQEDVRVCLDPEGHPFCLWTAV
ncbi:MAG: GNAT family N-acetyltransferase [Dermatophilaceae bacterium]